MKVSIITVCKNSVSTIEDTILSVATQTYSNIEYIIIDGLSNDGTIEIINKHIKYVTKFISEKDDGIYHAMNRGIEMAEGDIIGILNSDDFFANESVIKNVVQCFELNKTDCVYGDLVYVHKTDTKKISRVWKAGKATAREFYCGWMPPHPAFFLKKSVYTDFGNFNTKFRIASDYELMLRMMLKHKISFSYLPEIITYMRLGGASNVSINSRIISFKENLEAWKINNLSPYFFTIPLKIIRKVFQFKMRLPKDKQNLK